jgi:hypothetical protein
MKRSVLVIGAVAVALALGGCSAGGAQSSSSGSVASAPDSAVGGKTVDAAKPGADRSVVTAGTITLTVDRPSTAADRAAAIADAAGGRVDARDEKAPADLVAIESELTTRQSDLESLETQQRSLADQVDLATITLRLGSVATAPKQAPATFASGFVAGWDALVGFLGVLVVVLGVALPWLAFAAVIALATLWVVRSIRRRRGVSAP